MGPTLLADKDAGRIAFRGCRDPRVLFLVVGLNLPQVHQHPLYNVALGPLETVVLGDGTYDAVERRRRSSDTEREGVP